MNLTDFYFLCAFALMLIIYYIVPKKAQWIVLLTGSIAYYIAGREPALILYPVLSIALCWGISVLFGVVDRAREKSTAAGTGDSKKYDRIRSALLAVGIVLLLAVLILLKYLKFTALSDLLVPLGLSYYTFTLIGYVVDVYYGIAEPQKNLLKLMAFGLYFPALVSGPIMQYREVRDSFFEEHAFDWNSIFRGMQRMLWGFFKKLVIAERLGTLVATVYSDPQTYGGAYVWLAILAFTFQLYTDFSGLMDIVLGISQCFGITLPENFKTPFFSRTVTEYWRRWHMTLGVWFKEYVFYRILRTTAYTRLQKKFKEKFGKKRGKQLAVFIAMFILWLIIGLWHGGNLTFVIGSGLLHWFYIVMEELLEPPCTAFWKKKNIDPKAGWLEKLRVLRTFILVNIGNAFFRSASVGEAFRMFGCGFGEHKLGELLHGGIFSLGLDYIDFTIAVVSLAVLWAVSLMQKRIEDGKYAGLAEKTGRSLTCVRDIIETKPLLLRFAVWMALLFYVILLGQYGPGYSAAEFIYQGF